MLSDLSIFNIGIMSYCSQSSIRGIEELVRRGVILWSEPPGLQYPPKRLHDIEMWGVWRQEKQEQSPLLPNPSQFHSSLASVDGGVIKHNDRFLSHCKGETVEKIHNLRCANTGLCGEPVIDIAAAYHAKYIQPCGSLGGNMDIV